MTPEMDKQNRRAARILRNFGRYVSEAAAQSSLETSTIDRTGLPKATTLPATDAELAALDTPTIARTKPRAYARIKRSVAWRLMAKGRK